MSCLCFASEASAIDASPIAEPSVIYAREPAPPAPVRMASSERPNMGGGIRNSPSGWHHQSYTERTAPNDDATGREKVRSLKEQYSLEDPSVMEHRLELGDLVTNSIQTVFPTLVIQQILNALAVRQLVPRGVEKSELLWTVLGFEDDDMDMLNVRLKANNLVGPAAFRERVA